MAYDSVFGYVPPMAAPAAAAPVQGPQPMVAAPAPAAATRGALNPSSVPNVTPLAYIGAAGAQAGAPAAMAYDTKSGVASALAAGASGAASGALIGSVVPGVGTAVGAGVGGAIGLITGGLNAWLSVGSKNKAEREQRRLLKEAEAKQAKRDKIARDDALSQQAYDRKQVELQKKWAKNLQTRQAIQQIMADDTAARDLFVKTGRV